MSGVVWTQEAWVRYGTRWGAPRYDGSFWVLPDVPERHEIAVLLIPRETAQAGLAWVATWYEDHVRDATGDISPEQLPHCTPRKAPYGCVDEDDNTCTLRCDRVNCGLHVVRPGSTQCWCDDE